MEQQLNNQSAYLSEAIDNQLLWFKKKKQGCIYGTTRAEQHHDNIQVFLSSQN